MNKPDCTCEAGYKGEVYHCPFHAATPEMYEALLAVYQDIELQNVEGGSAELNIMVDQALAKAEGR